MSYKTGVRYFSLQYLSSGAVSVSFRLSGFETLYPSFIVCHVQEGAMFTTLQIDMSRRELVYTQSNMLLSELSMMPFSSEHDPDLNTHHDHFGSNKHKTLVMVVNMTKMSLVLENSFSEFREPNWIMAQLFSMHNHHS